MNCIKLHFYFDLECWYYYAWGRRKFKHYEIKIRLSYFKNWLTDWLNHFWFEVPGDYVGLISLVLSKTLNSGSQSNLETYYRVSSIKEWRTTYDNKNIHVYWWTKLFMMSICMAILYALGLKLDIWKYEIFWKWPNEYVLVPRLTQAWTGTRTRLYALTWAWSAQPGRGVTRTWEIPLLIWSTRDVVTHWTC